MVKTGEFLVVLLIFNELSKFGIAVSQGVAGSFRDSVLQLKSRNAANINQAYKLYIQILQ